MNKKKACQFFIFWKFVQNWNIVKIISHRSTTTILKKDTRAFCFRKEKSFPFNNLILKTKCNKWVTILKQLLVMKLGLRTSAEIRSINVGVGTGRDN
jgi:hypothetical protein